MEQIIANSSRLLPGDIDKMFQGEIKPVRYSFAYRIGLICVLVGMVALPLIYLALIAEKAEAGLQEK